MHSRTILRCLTRGIILLLLASTTAFAAAPTATSVNITGTPALGQILTGSYSYSDADGDPQGTSQFRWLRNGTPIGGTNSTSYTVVAADQGNTLAFEVTPVAASGLPGELIGSPAQSAGVQVAPNAPPTASSVNITGTPALGQTLTGNYSYNDADGDPQGTSTFRWLRNGAPIGGTNSTSYTVVAADQGNNLRFEVRPVASSGASPGNAALSPPVAITPNAAPTASSVNITGTPALGQTLTGNYSYNDADGDPQGTSTFRWLRNGTPIGGTNSTSYTVVSADVGASLRFEVTPVASSGTSTGSPVQSAGLTINSPPVASNVRINGAPELGELLTGSYVYSDADGDSQGASTYRWLRNGSPIGGANGTNYRVVAADQGTTLVFEVTPVATAGASPGIAVASPGVGITANAPPTATNVSISGTPEVGQVLTGSYTYADVDGDPQGTSTFRWLRDGAAINGQTGQAYTVRAADKNTTLRFEVTPVAASGASPGTAVASAGIDVLNDVPVITGQEPLSTDEDTFFDIQLSDLTVSDDDNTYPDDFRLIVVDGPNYSVSGSRVTPDLNYDQDLTVTVRVNDGLDDSQAFQLDVQVRPVNDAPRIDGQPTLSMPEDSSRPVTFIDLNVSDPDNNYPNGFSLTVLPALPGSNYTESLNSITPDLNFNGNLSVPVIVNDGALDSAPFNLVVSVDPVNDAPLQVDPIEDQQATENSPYSLDVSQYFTDVDGDALSYTAVGLPGPFMLDPASGLIVGTPVFEDTSDTPFVVVINASDGGAEGDATISYSFTVAALGRANVGLSINAAPDPAMLNDQVQWTFTAGNTGPEAAAFLELTGSVVGSGVVVAPVGSSVCTIQAPVGDMTGFTCTLNDVPNGGSTSAIIASTTGTAGDVFVSATATITELLPIDPNLDNNTVQASVGVAESFSNGTVQTLGSANAGGFAVGDVDGDGDADLVIGTINGQSMEIYLSTGNRSFADAPVLIPDSSLVQGVALADVDGDADLDVVLATGGGEPDLIYANDSAGSFVLLVTLGGSFSADVVAADINNDTFEDLVFATISGNLVYIGDGVGGFTLRDTLGTANSQAVAVADLDGDSWLDIVSANSGAPSTVRLSIDGTRFGSPAEIAAGNVTDVAVEDFNADGIVDLAFARLTGTATDVPANPIFLNDGSGTFSFLVALGAAASTSALAGDVDDDGFADLVVVNDNGVHQIWRGDGIGFSLYGEQIVEQNGLHGVLADLGNDGGLDLALGGIAQAGTDIFLNDGFGNLGKGDAVPPVIAIVGESTVEVPSGSPYVDAGATAEDNIDGDVSNQIVARSNVDTSVVGNYLVTYDVTDIAGNQAIQTSRTVTVTPASGTGGGGGGVFGTFLIMFLSMVYLRNAARASRAVNKIDSASRKSLRVTV